MSYLPRNDVFSWGRVVRQSQRIACPRFKADIPAFIGNRPGGGVLPVGLRRSYGDTVFNLPGGVIEMTGLDRLIAFDPATGILRAEAGLSLDELLRFTVPRGYFVPVTPGTRFVTLGGAIGNDIHGKNHHRAGTFGRHVRRLGLVRSDGAAQELGPEDESGIFAATIGGLGLTGVIIWAELQLQPIRSSQLEVEIIPYGTLSEFWDIAEASNDSHEHTVAWIDCTARNRAAGRGIFSRGNWAEDGELTAHPPGNALSVPFEAPSGTLNNFSVSLFNRFYYKMQTMKAKPHRQHYSEFFYPLDHLRNWNRIYGPKGFWQYQCVVPPETMKDATAALIDAISRSGQGSFLAVLKTFGDMPPPGLLSFPQQGTTLALDFPNRGGKTLKLLSRLDAIVAEARGRLYAAKDGRIPPDMWWRGYSARDQFLPHIDPAFGSDFWRRVNP